jgi:hypothetical protein
VAEGRLHRGGRADDQLDDLVVGDVGHRRVRDHPPVAQHGQPVGDLADGG